MGNLSIYESLKNTDGYIDYSENIEFEYRYKYDYLSEGIKRNYRNIVLRSLFSIYNGDSESLNFPKTGYPVSSYVENLVSFVRGIVAENIIPAEWVENFVKTTILNSEDEKEVQATLALGEYFLPQSLVREVAKVFSKSGNYIVYAMGVIKRMENYNTFLFDLIKNSKGMIKLTAAENIEEIDMKITKYMITEGYKDEYYEPFMTDITVDLFNCPAYLLREDITAEEVNEFCKLFVKFFRNSGPYTLNGEIDFLDTLLYNIEKYGDSIEALYCIFAIRELVLEDGSVSIDEESFREGIKELASQEKYKKILKNAFKVGEFEFTDLLVMASEIDMNISFSMIKKYMKSNMYNPEIYRFLLESDVFLSNIELIQFVEKNFDFSDIIGNMEGISLREERALNKKEEVFDLILSELYKFYPIGLDLLKKGMEANSTRIRRRTAEVLKKLKRQLPNEFIDYIAQRFCMEIIPEVKSIYHRIINRDAHKDIERISVEDIRVGMHPKDIYVLDSDIAGLAYRDREMLENELKENARLFMKRDAFNTHDVRAVKIVSKTGFVLGFLPKKDNEVISRLMDSGKYFYCVVDEVDMDRLHAKIEVYMSYKDVMQELDNLARNLSFEPKKKKYN